MKELNNFLKKYCGNPFLPYSNSNQINWRSELVFKMSDLSGRNYFKRSNLDQILSRKFKFLYINIIIV